MIRNLAEGVQAFTSNAFLVSGVPRTDEPARTEDGETGRRLLVDTGSNFDVAARVREHVDDLDAVVLTHTHPDHIGALADVRDAFGVETWGFDVSLDEVDNEIPDEGTVAMGTAEFEAMHTPGHKNDHLCLYAPDERVLFAGDLVFRNGSFGRTDLAEGDRDLLIDSIDRVRKRVGEDLRELHVGHGASVLTNPSRDVELAARTARTQ